MSSSRLFSKLWILNLRELGMIINWNNQIPSPNRNIKWAASWQNQQNDLCAQRRLRSAWVSAQSDQSFRSALYG